MPGLLRRRLRIGLGGMLVAILMIGLWLGYRVNKAREQLRALAAVKAQEGWVRYADEFVMGPVNVHRGDAMWKPGWGTHSPSKVSSVPPLLRRWIGDEYFREIVHVSTFVDIQAGEAGEPYPVHPPINGMLRSLESQKGIRTLQISGDTVTDEGLASIAKLTNLRELFIFWAAGVNDAGVARVGRMPKLEQVNISLSTMTDEGVGHLANLPALEKLSLGGKRFTDASLIHLAQAKRLKWLELEAYRMEITDAGLEHLAGLKDLERLDIKHARFTPEGKAKLIKAIPDLKIFP